MLEKSINRQASCCLQNPHDLIWCLLNTLLVEYPNLFGTRDWFCGRQFLHGLGGGDGLGWFKHITFSVDFISNLMPLLIWQKVLVHGPEAGDPLSCGVPKIPKNSKGFQQNFKLSFTGESMKVRLKDCFNRVLHTCSIKCLVTKEFISETQLTFVLISKEKD